MKRINDFTGYIVRPIIVINEEGLPLPYHFKGKVFIEVIDENVHTPVAYAVYARYYKAGEKHLADYLTKNQAFKAVSRRYHLLMRL